MRKLSLSVAILTGMCIQSLPAQAIEDYAPHVKSSIEGYIRPAFAVFAEKTAAMPRAVKALCDTGTDQKRAAFASAYGDVVSAFGGISFLRFGPLIDDHRLDSLAFMPDPRGITQRQIRKAFAAKDQGLTEASSLREKSVALQGLTALQLIAFDKDGAVSLGKSGDNRDLVCGYAVAIAQNVADIAADLEREWNDDKGFSDALLNPRDDSQIRSSKEAIETIFNALVTGLIVVKDQELLPALGAEIGKARGNRFPFSRSQNGSTYVSAELEGIRQALDAAGFEQVLDDDFKWIPQSVAFEFDNGLNVLDTMDQPIRQSLQDPDVYKKLSLLTIIVNSLRDTIALELAGALGLSGGFNALDGD
ncbi:imelysin family protein [Roseibium sp.]|uniref:imelysin family protein n=1 Tax=Roseibium sp. TaxID=1936156 RepID=UPI003A96914B